MAPLEPLEEKTRGPVRRHKRTQWQPLGEHIGGQKSWGNLTCTETKIKLVGNGSEKAKRQHNPSSGKAKKSTFATCPHGALKQTGTGPQTAVGEHIGGQKTCGDLHSDKNEARWQRIRKGRTPSQPDRTQTAIGAFATRPHGTGPKRHL